MCLKIIKLKLRSQAPAAELAAERLEPYKSVLKFPLIIAEQSAQLGG